MTRDEIEMWYGVRQRLMQERHHRERLALYREYIRQMEIAGAPVEPTALEIRGSSVLTVLRRALVSQEPTGRDGSNGMQRRE